MLVFFKVSMLGFGGGPSSIPLMHKEVVEKHKWLDNDEFADILAIGNSLPGPILTKMAGYMGYRMKGILGAITALLITTIPTVIGMILIFSALGSLQNSTRVEGMTQAIQLVVGVMLAALAFGFISNNRKKIGYITTLVLTAGSIVLMYSLNMHPAILIAILLIGGFCYAKPLHKNKPPFESEGSQ